MKLLTKKLKECSEKPDDEKEEMIGEIGHYIDACLIIALAVIVLTDFQIPSPLISVLIFFGSMIAIMEFSLGRKLFGLAAMLLLCFLVIARLIWYPFYAIYQKARGRKLKVEVAD